MEKIWAKYKKHILIGVAVLAFLIVVAYFIGKAAGKKEKPAEITYKNPVVKPDGTIVYEGEENYDPGPLTERLYKDMDGYNLLNLGRRDMEAYKAFAELKDPPMIAVYNEWIRKYWEKAGKKTVFEKLAEEREWTIPEIAKPFTYVLNLFMPASPLTVAHTVPSEGFAEKRETILGKAKSLGLYKKP